MPYPRQWNRTPMNDLRPQFYLDPEVLFLNHGSFGASPRPVIESYQDWQRRLERQPVKFLIREFQEHLRSARQDLGRALGADPDHLVYVPNATFGVNVIARSMKFQPGDELLTSNQEYGACKNIWALVMFIPSILQGSTRIFALTKLF